MNQSNHLYRDIIAGLFLIVGVIGFLSGEFIMSSVLFCTAATLSNLIVVNKTAV
jgi:hypothetical protein